MPFTFDRYVFLTLYKSSASSYRTPWDHRYLVVFFKHLLHYVKALHSLNISHEDLKRSNVLVDGYHLPVLVDFGFSHFTAEGRMVMSAGGTLDYSSPEKVAVRAMIRWSSWAHAAQNVFYDPKANDVWALGILLAKLLGMPHPFFSPDEDDASEKVKQRIVEEEPVFHWQPEDEVPGGKKELVMGMLQRDPEQRLTVSPAYFAQSSADPKQISEILNHPYLQAPHPDPKRYRPPPLELPGSLSLPLSPGIIQDLCFLAYLNNDYYLCETPRKIEERLVSPEPRWEKRWAGLLSAWIKRAEMDWEDVSKVVEKPKRRSGRHRNVKLATDKL